MTNGYTLDKFTGYKGKHELKIYEDGEIIENIASQSLEYLNQFLKDQYPQYL